MRSRSRRQSSLPRHLVLRFGRQKLARSKMHPVGHLLTGPVLHHAGGWRHPASDVHQILNPSGTRISRGFTRAACSTACVRVCRAEVHAPGAVVDKPRRCPLFRELHETSLAKSAHFGRAINRCIQGRWRANNRRAGQQGRARVGDPGELDLILLRVYCQKQYSTTQISAGIGRIQFRA